MSAWKAFEREAAALFDGTRFWANSGERRDFKGWLYGQMVYGQCKLTKRLSLEALTQLAEEEGVDVVCIKRRRGKARKSAPLVVMTFAKFHVLMVHAHGRP